MADERVDAGGGRVPDGWEGPVTEFGHDRTGRRPRAPYETQTAQAAGSEAIWTIEPVELSVTALGPVSDGSGVDPFDRRHGPADRRVKQGSAPDGDERRIGPADRRATVGG